MELTTSRIDTVAVLQLQGRFDAYTVVLVEEWLHQQGDQVVINMSQVNFIDTAALTTLAQNVEQRRRQRNGFLRLCELSQTVQIILELTRFDRVFDTYVSEHAAITEKSYALVA